jgi:RNA polymerase sigma-70 factor, ECF subfamily
MTTPDFALLLQRIAGGDEAALQQLYVEYRPRLRRYLWHQLDGDIYAVEEALQDTFLAVWRTAGAFRGEAKVASWLFQIAHYRALRARQMAERQAGVRLDRDERDEQAVEQMPLAYPPEDVVLDRVALDEALGRLSAKHRAVLHLVFQQGFTAEEVAQILDVPVGTVKSRISYARRALSDALSAKTP